MKTYILIILAGGTGALLRHFLSGIIRSSGASGLPWGTLTVNILGCFLFGLVWSLMEEKYLIHPTTGLIVLTGFVGSFTTFSTMTFETFSMIQTSAWVNAFLYVLSGQILGIVAAFTGINMARLF